MTAEPASMSAADLKSARGSYTTAQQTAYDSAFTSLQSLATATRCAAPDAVHL